MIEHLRRFFATEFGRALTQFLRVSLAAGFAAWSAAGWPLSDLTGEQALSFIELGVQAGLSLVLVNYFAPWEQRFGHKKVESSTH